MKDSRWYFGAALVVVLILGGIALVIHSQKNSSLPSGETPSTVSDSPISQTVYTQGTSSAIINPNAIPE